MYGLLSLEYTNATTSEHSGFINGQGGVDGLDTIDIS